MGNSRRALIIGGMIGLAACASNTTQNDLAGAPSAWLDQFEGENTTCQDFNESYVNKGELHGAPNQKEINVYLSELMFSRLPGGKLPDTVHLSANTEAGQLSVMMTGETQSELGYQLSCLSGWHVLRKSRSGQYLGDGVVEKHYGQVSFFRMGRRRELIVRVLVDAEFNSMYIFDSEIHEEQWYRFQAMTDR